MIKYCQENEIANKRQSMPLISQSNSNSEKNESDSNIEENHDYDWMQKNALCIMKI